MSSLWWAAGTASRIHLFHSFVLMFTFLHYNKIASKHERSSVSASFSALAAGHIPCTIYLLLLYSLTFSHNCPLNSNT